MKNTLDNLCRNLANQEGWRNIAADLRARAIGSHLAILREPYLKYIMEGKKTVESRFSKVRCAPYKRVFEGDVLILKRSGGPIVGVCQVRQVWFYDVDAKSLNLIRDRFGAKICPENGDFWTERAHTYYATLMSISEFTPIAKLSVKKRDRRGWMVISDRCESILTLK